ncbi:hypothetical protein ACFOWX_05640 [Sphingorhabdus arenilitoris]|uniref:Uncharacterized protein n=1 Tax=Sphingorhabdus arenilitoris TaxID=1490041 RepID=A0ABV8RF71_9SPHN
MGENIDLVYNLPDTPAYESDDGYLDVGYIYEEKNIFFLPIFVSSSNGRFILFTGDRYMELDDAAIAELKRDLGVDPTAGYEFNAWQHIWGWLIIIPLFAFGALKKLLHRHAGADQIPDYEQPAAPERRTSQPPRPSNGADILDSDPAPSNNRVMGGFGRKGL